MGGAKLRAGKAWNYGRIPVLDIGPYLAGDAAPRRRSRALSRAPSKILAFW